MVAFRKLFPVLAGLALSSASAFAQLNCTAGAGQNNVRVEGFTELVGDIQIRCSGGTGTTPVPINITVYLNTAITSRNLGTVSGQTITEALLTTTNSGTPGCVSNDPTANNGTAACNGGLYNVIRGARQPGTENAIVFANVPVVPQGTNPQPTVLTIQNIRANATSFAVTAGTTPPQIRASVLTQGNVGGDISADLSVGLVNQGLLFDTTSCSGATRSSASSIAQCSGLNTGLPTTAKDVAASFGLRFREGFASAFRPRQADLNSRGEDGNITAGALPAGGSVAGAADTGTRLAARFTNIPSGVRLFVTTGAVYGAGANAATTATTPSLSAALRAVDPATGLNATGGTITNSNISLTCDNTAATGGGAANSSQPAAELAVSGGTATAVWEVTASNDLLPETALFGVGVAASTGAGLTNTASPVTVTGSFAPFYAPTQTPSPASATSGLAIPRFTSTGISNTNTFAVNVCQTNLLFPFVTNFAGFDTGIAISNTSADPFKATNAQSGAVRVTYFGSTCTLGASGANCAASTKPVSASSPLIPAGQTFTFTVSSGAATGAGLPTANMSAEDIASFSNPTFNGYAIVQADFQFAHGYAFITAPNGSTTGYMGLVLTGADRGNAVSSESLNN